MAARRQAPSAKEELFHFKVVLLGTWTERLSEETDSRVLSRTDGLATEHCYHKHLFVLWSVVMLVVGNVSRFSHGCLVAEVAFEIGI